MNQDQPPPYSAAMGHPTAPGFHAPPSQPLIEKSKGGPPAQDYPPAQGYPPQGYPPQGYPPQGYPSQGYPPNQGYPPQGVPGYPPGPMQSQAAYIPPQPGSTTVVVTSPAIIAAYGPQAQPMACPHCHAQITSRVLNEPGMKTHLIALILCLIGCIPCCLIPYCVDSCQNRNHYCPSCNAFLGSYDADGGWNRRY